MRNTFGVDFKILIVGNSWVGKTSFVQKWIKGIFNDSYKATIASNFEYKIINKESAIYRIQLWDIGGQDKNTYVTKLFCKGAHAAVIFCAAGDESSRNDTLRWKNAITETTSVFAISDIPIILVENKCDLLIEPNSGYDQLKIFSQKNGFIECFQTSVKNNINVNQSMDFLIESIIHKLKYIDKESIESHQTIQEMKDNVIVSKRFIENNENIKKKSGCC